MSDHNLINICPKCGEVNKASAKFCVKCGAPLKSDLAASLTALDRVKQLQPAVDEMLLNLRRYAFREMEAASITALNQLNVCPNLNNLESFLRKLEPKELSDKSHRDVLAKQRGLIEHLKSFDRQKLSITLAKFESQKAKSGGVGDWQTIVQKYQDLCGQLKAENKFHEDDHVDFSKMKFADLSNDKSVSNNVLFNTSVSQIKFLLKLKEHLNVIKQRLV